MAMRYVILAGILAAVVSGAVLDLCAGNLDTLAGAQAFFTTAFAFQCSTDADCLTGTAFSALPAGLDPHGPCMNIRCLDTQLIVTNANIDSHQDVYVCGFPDHAYAILTAKFCVYGVEVDEYNSVLGQQLATFVAGGGAAVATDIRLGGGFARWIPELYNNIACTVSLYTTDLEVQCMRGMCGVLTANPALNITGAPYGCHTLIDDPLLSRYGHFTGTRVLAHTDRLTTYGDLLITYEGTEMQAQYNGNAYGRSRTVQYAVMSANSYGMDPAHGCGSTVDYCIWSDPRGLFQAGIPCNLSSSPGADTYCNNALCTGSGRCGVAMNLGLTCPLTNVYLGPTYETAADIGGVLGKSLISADCVSRRPVCIQRTATEQDLTPEALAVQRAGIDWVYEVLADAQTHLASASTPGSISTYVQGPPLDLPNGNAASFVLLQQTQRTFGQDMFPADAPAVCAFTGPSDIIRGSSPCALDDANAHLLPGQTNPGCVQTDQTGTPIGICTGEFATPTVDADGALVVVGYPVTPDIIQVAICRPNGHALAGSICQPNISVEVIIANTSADAACLVAVCDGIGGCGWYTRPIGSPCISLAAQALTPCAVQTCDGGGNCITGAPPPSAHTQCPSPSVCQAPGTCHHTTCVPGPLIAGCVACTVDADCQCTGLDAVVGWCDVSRGICSQPALLPPMAIDPEDATVWLPLQPSEQGLGDGSDDDDGGGGQADEDWDGNWVGGLETASRRGHRFCQPPPRGPPTCLLGRGMCGLNGVCGPPAPLCRYVRPPCNASDQSAGNSSNSNSNTNNTSNTTNTSLPEHEHEHKHKERNCDTVPPAADDSACNSSVCMVEPAFASWFAAPGEVCLAAGDCRSAAVCGPWAPSAANAMLANFSACNATICDLASVVPVPAGTSCAQQTVAPGASRDLCAVDLQCDGSGLCAVINRTRCTTFPLIATVISGNALVDYGTCVAPVACDATTGLCPAGRMVDPLPYGASCIDFCSFPQTHGSCDGTGACRHINQPCAQLSQCTTGQCNPSARLDLPTSNWAPVDVGLATVGTCVYRPVEDLVSQGGSISCSTTNDPCVINQVCNGGGMCGGGGNVTCAPSTSCSVSVGCSLVTGTCMFQALPVGTPCPPSGALGGGVCLANTTCQGTRGCIGVPVACPQLPNVTAASINASCVGFHATCEGILDLITGSLPDMPGVMGVVSVILPSGDLVLLSDTTIGAEDLLLNITGFANTTQFAGLLIDQRGLVVSRAEATTVSGVCVYYSAASGSPCSTGDICAAAASCTSAGTCVATRLIRCPDGSGENCMSRNGTCIPFVGCTYTVLENSEICNDNDACTQNDICHVGGICSGTPLGCPAAPAQSCQFYPPGQTCASGCTLANVSDGTNCSCHTKTPGGPLLCTGVCIRGFCQAQVFTCSPPCPTNLTTSGRPRFECVTPGICQCTTGLTTINCTTTSEQTAFIPCMSSNAAGALGLSGSIFLLTISLLSVCLCSCLCVFCIEACVSATTGHVLR